MNVGHCDSTWAYGQGLREEPVAESTKPMKLIDSAHCAVEPRLLAQLAESIVRIQPLVDFAIFLPCCNSMFSVHI